MAEQQPPFARRPADALLVVFFVLHIATALLIDVQCLLPPRLLALYPAPLRSALAFHVRTNHDFLVARKPAWFVSFVACEILLQTPFFFAAAYAFWAGKEWIRVPALLYGAHTATTMVAILTEIFASSMPLFPERATLAGVYVPFLLVPVLLIVRVLRTPVFAENGTKKRD